MSRRPGDGALPVPPDSPLSALLHNTTDLIFRWRIASPQGFDYLSPSVADLTGRAPEEFYADPALGTEVVHPEDRDVAEATLRGDVDPATTSQRMRLVHPDGRVFVTELRHIVIAGPDGSPVAIEGIARDITDQDQIEIELRRRTQELDEAQALAHLGSWTWDLRTNAVRYSGSSCRVFGLDLEVPDRHFDELLATVHPDDVDRTNEILRVAVETGEPFSVDIRIVRPAGDVRWIRSQGIAILDASRDPIQAYGTALDITDQKAAADALARSDARLRVTMESAPDAVISTDVAGRILFVNLQVEELFGYSPAELLGESVDGLLPEHLADRHSAHRALYVTDPATRAMGTGLELAGRRKDGTCFPGGHQLELGRDGRGLGADRVRARRH